MGRAAAAGGSTPPRGPFAVDHDRALAELELAWSEGGYHGFTASGGTWCAVTSAGEVLTGATSDELVRGGSPRGGHPAAVRGPVAGRGCWPHPRRVGSWRTDGSARCDLPGRRHRHGRARAAAG